MSNCSDTPVSYGETSQHASVTWLTHGRKVGSIPAKNHDTYLELHSKLLALHPKQRLLLLHSQHLHCQPISFLKILKLGSVGLLRVGAVQRHSRRRKNGCTVDQLRLPLGLLPSTVLGSGERCFKLPPPWFSLGTLAPTLVACALLVPKDVRRAPPAALPKKQWRCKASTFLTPVAARTWRPWS
eukprot:scaffold2862_cov272-Pinguiococcus_pyrenoidosus.AAC.3